MAELPPVPEPTNGWSRFERVIVYRLDKLDESLVGVRQELHDIRNDEIARLKVDIAMLKVKSGLWGAAAGFIPAALVVAYVLLGGH